MISETEIESLRAELGQLRVSNATHVETRALQREVAEYKSLAEEIRELRRSVEALRVALVNIYETNVVLEELRHG